MANARSADPTSATLIPSENGRSPHGRRRTTRKPSTIRQLATYIFPRVRILCLQVAQSPVFLACLQIPPPTTQRIDRDQANDPNCVNNRQRESMSRRSRLAHSKQILE